MSIFVAMAYTREVFGDYDNIPLGRVILLYVRVICIIFVIVTFKNNNRFVCLQ